MNLTRDTLQALADRDLTLREASIELEANHETVRNAAWRMGVKFKPGKQGRRAPIPDEIIRDMAARGLTIPQAAAETGASDKYLRKRARECGVWLGKVKRGPALDAMPRPAAPPKQPVTSAPAFAQIAAQENARMRAEMSR